MGCSVKMTMVTDGDKRLGTCRHRHGKDNMEKFRMATSLPSKSPDIYEGRGFQLVSYTLS